MSIGETLLSARRDAGLSIAEVSSRTRIKLNVIDDIEHDDYSACGGDHRARDTIAAIARAVGVDSGPLIEAYNAARRPAGWIAATSSSEPAGVVRAPEPLTPQPEPDTLPSLAEPDPVRPEPESAQPALAAAELAAATEDTQPIRTVQPPEPVTTGEPAGPLTIGESPFQAAPAGSVIPAEPYSPVRLPVADRRPLVWLALAGGLFVVALIGGILLITGAGGHPTPHAAVAGPHDTGRRGATHPARTAPPGHSGRSPGQARPASHPHHQSAYALVPASIQAFGPGGAGHGDSPQLARQALTGKTAAPWHSAWYTTSHFGDLQSGTGLLLDMGRRVTITSARIVLGKNPGTDLALRIGNAPALASLPSVARENGAAGVVRLRTAPTQGRYVLVWFTKLPPDQAGTFQVSVYDIMLRGRA